MRASPDVIHHLMGVDYDRINDQAHKSVSPQGQGHAGSFEI